MCRSAVCSHNSLWTNCAVDRGLFEVRCHKTKLLTRRSHFSMLCFFFVESQCGGGATMNYGSPWGVARSKKQTHSWSCRDDSFHQKEPATHFPPKNLVQRPHHCMLTEVWDFVWLKYGHSATGSSVLCQSKSWRQRKIVNWYFVWLKCGNFAITLRWFHRKCLFFIYHHVL